MNHLTERDFARKFGKVAADCRLGDDLHKEVNILSEFGIMDKVLRNTVDHFNETVMTVSSLTEEAIDLFDGNPHRSEDL